ncbi:TadE/TadG family protein [Hellea sp.]|nr:TadE/TadG family protein [Hellea sp.]
MLKRYLLNTSGNFGIMFALFSTALMLGAGVAVDWAGMVKQRSVLQNYVDAAVLAAVTAETEDPTELQRIVDEHIALLNVNGWDISAPVRIVDGDVVVDASSTYDTLLLGVAKSLVGNPNGEHLMVGTSTAAPLLQGIPINVALVLDTTSSMDGPNIEALRNAAETLLFDLEALDGDIRVSIVPFGEYVNILSQDGQPWLDTSRNGTTDNIVDEPYQRRDRLTNNVCTPTGRIIPGNPIISDGVVVGNRPDRDEQTCVGETFGPEYTDYLNYQISYEWYGCAGSRDNGDNDRAAFAGVKIPGAMEETASGDRNYTRNARCGDELLPLNNNFTNMRTFISNLSTAGETYIPSGLMWGWRTLTREAPYTEAASSPDGSVSAMIFMTDGFNTRSQKDVHHDGGDEDAGVALGATICENIKNDSIHIYTVAYDIPNVADAQATETMLRNCATDSDSVYTPDNAAELEADFRSIGSRLRTVRLKYRPS